MCKHVQNPPMGKYQHTISGPVSVFLIVITWAPTFLMSAERKEGDRMYERDVKPSDVISCCSK